MIKNLIKIENGKLVPSLDQLDADLIEISSESNNLLKVKEDGLYLAFSADDDLILSENKIKIKEIEGKLQETTVDSGTSLSISDHINNIYSILSKIKKDSSFSNDTYDIVRREDLNKTASVYRDGVLIEQPKIILQEVSTNDDGIWTVDYSYLNLTENPIILATGITAGDKVADRRFASVNTISPTSCSGILLSSSSAGLLAAMTMVTGKGSLMVAVIGK